MQTYVPQATPAYSPTQQVQAQTSSQQGTAQGSDGYLDSVSGESLEVLQHFGAEAPALLNRYACVVEDALLTQTKTASDLAGRVEKLSANLDGAKKVVDAAASDNAAYHTMLTNPDMLSSYVNEFFGPNGPHPVEIAQDRLAAEVAANEARSAQAQAQAPVPNQVTAPEGQTPTQQF
jgi:outer membrane murein-binding lipoprotein Lpp